MIILLLSVEGCFSIDLRYKMSLLHLMLVFGLMDASYQHNVRFCNGVMQKFYRDLFIKGWGEMKAVKIYGIVICGITNSC